MSTSNEIDWTPVCSGGSTYQELKLVEVSKFRIEFRASGYIRVVCLVLMAMGFGGFVLGAFLASSSLLGAAMFVVAGLVIGGAGLVMLKIADRHRVFDKRVGWYWTGPRPRDSTDVKRRSDAVQLKRIRAVQILAKLVEFTGGESPRNTIETNYEINLVLDDGSRVNVQAGGGEGRALASHADSLGAFLDVPVLDGRHSQTNSKVY